jgi:hypothetical protein
VTEDVLVRFIVGYDILVDCWERLLYSIYAFLGAAPHTRHQTPPQPSLLPNPNPLHFPGEAERSTTRHPIVAGDGGSRFVL